MDFPNHQVPREAKYSGTWKVQGIETDNWKDDLWQGEYVVFLFSKIDKRLVNIYYSLKTSQTIHPFSVMKLFNTGNADSHSFKNYFVQSIIPKRPDDKEFILPPFCR